MTQLTITGPFINRTLFEQAGIDVPSDMSDSVTWDEWADASRAVAEALEIPYPMAMDRSGHRFAGPAISSGAMYFDDMGHPTVMDDGFRNMAERFVNWHLDGTMHPGDVAAERRLRRRQRRIRQCRAGLLHVRQLAGWAVQRANRRCLRLADGAESLRSRRLHRHAGGAALVGIGGTEHPEEVARVMEYLASQEVLGEFAARTLFIPAHAGLSASGVDFDTDLQLAKDSLGVFVGSSRHA